MYSNKIIKNKIGETKSMANFRRDRMDTEISITTRQKPRE